MKCMLSRTVLHHTECRSHTKQTYLAVLGAGQGWKVVALDRKVAAGPQLSAKVQRGANALVELPISGRLAYNLCDDMSAA